MWRGIAVAQSRPGWLKIQGDTSIVTVESPALGEPRRLTLYKPPGWTPDQGYPVVYAADGQYLNPYLFDLGRMITAGEVPPIVVVGLWSAEGRGGLLTRSDEYLPGYGDARRHANFKRYFLDEVVPFAAARLGASDRRDDRMLFGYSDGATWALDTGLRNPDRFGTVCTLSIGWEAAGDHIGVANRPRLYFGIGSNETAFKAVTTRIVERARRASGEVIFRTGQGGHEDKVWRPMFKEAVKWAFVRA